MKKRTRIILGIVLAVLLALALLIALSRCDPAEPAPEAPTNPTGAAVTTPTSGTEPTVKETDPTVAPTAVPTTAPTAAPTDAPTQAPTQKPTAAPTQKPTQAPTQMPTEKPTQAPTQKPTKAPTQPSGCAHSFGKWKYEEYTYEAYSASGRLKTYTSHRKVRICSKCGYKETGGTPDHICTYGCNNHTEKVIEKATCTKGPLYRSTCTICGWHEDYRSDETGPHSVTEEFRHLTDYGPYTNELDATISTCTVCGLSTTTFVYGEGWSNYSPYRIKVVVQHGNAENFSLSHPEYQMVKRDFVYDSDGYVKQFTQYWWYNGKRYSQVVNCDKDFLTALFAEYGLTVKDGVTCQLAPDGAYIVPYKISYTC